MVALIWHMVGVVDAWPKVVNNDHGRDFASYYYAGLAATGGFDPYDKQDLGALAREDGTRKSVHPFLYPPPFVLGVAPFTRLTLKSAYAQWFWAMEGMAIGAMLVLSLWFRRLHWSAPAVLFLLLAAVTAVPNNLMMGQANFPVLLLLAAALWADAQDQQATAGMLLGCACMAKMSPALFVMWWMLQGRWRGVFASILTAVALSLAALAVMDPGTQLRFYTDVLPQFASGRYNGLSVPIDLFGNHSIPNLLDGVFPGSRGELSTAARWSARGITLVLLSLTGFACRARGDAWTHAAQACAIAVLMLLLPVYTYEHHLVFALPAAGFLVLALISGRLHKGLAVLVGAAILALAWDLQHLKTFAPVLREAKFGALLVLYVLCVWLGQRSSTPRTSA